MFKELEEFIDLAKSCTPDVLRLCDEFAFEYPEANFDDYRKVFKALINGYSYEKIVQHYAQEQAEKGRDIARSDLTTVLTMEDCLSEMLHDLKHGKQKGSTTHIELFDQAWTWRLGEFNIWTGYTNEGKSLFLRFLALVKAIMDKWRFAFYAPEDYPATEFFDDLIHMASGRSTDRDHPNCIKEATYLDVYNKIKDYFFFVYLRPPDNTLINILTEFSRLKDEEGISAAIIDPIIKVQRPKEFMNADDKYAGYVTTLATDFARTTNLSLHMVMHQLTPRLQENGLYPKPSYYNIKGGGTWVDGTDNVLAIQRPVYARDKLDSEVLFTSQKIKKQKLVGLPQEIAIRFDRKTNRYVDHSTMKDLFDFREKLGVTQLKIRAAIFDNL